MWWTNSLCTPANQDLGTLAEYDPLTGYEPNDCHISEATEPHTRNPRSGMGPRMTSSTITSPSARRSLHHCSLRSEKTMRAVDGTGLLTSRLRHTGKPQTRVQSSFAIDKTVDGPVEQVHRSTSWKCEHHTSHRPFFTVIYKRTYTRLAQVWVRTFTIISMLQAHCVSVVSACSLFDDSTFLSFLTISFCP